MCMIIKCDKMKELKKEIKTYNKQQLFLKEFPSFKHNSCTYDKSEEMIAYNINIISDNCIDKKELIKLIKKMYKQHQLDWVGLILKQKYVDGKK